MITLRANARLHRLSTRQGDLVSIAILTILWLCYFWRALTLQVSLPEGDFSGQFVAFGAYQYERFVSGEVPLWNPYNYAGSPFIGDTQSAVFYLPRLVTILGSYLTGGWTYASLQYEAVIHYWLAGLFMYLFVSRATRSHVGAVSSAIIFTYGGFLTGYPPLQLALLEAAVWLPLMLLGTFKASHHEGIWSFKWLSLAAFALGMSLLAGHPQTTLLSIYTLSAYMIFRARTRGLSWWRLGVGLAYVFSLGFGMAAVQVLPGLEYTRLTIRTALTTNELAAGFPFADLIVLVLPNVVTTFSPLYSGIAALILALFAVSGRDRNGRFWGVVAGVALLLSFGGRTVLYYVFASGLPAFNWFRGQERLAYIVAVSVSILAGYGIARLKDSATISSSWSRVLNWSVGLFWFGAFQVTLIDGYFPEIDMFALKNGIVFLSILVTLAWLLIVRLGRFAATRWWTVAIVSLLVFDAFSVTSHTNWEPVPVSERIGLTKLVETQQLESDLARIDGQWGLGGNFASMVGLYDIRGISPLRLQALEVYQTALPQYRMHELLAVKYVLTDWQELEVPSDVIAQDNSVEPPINLHEISTPMPRAWLVSEIIIANDETDAIAHLQDPGFDPRQTVILEQEPPVRLAAMENPSGSVTVVRYDPEFIELHVEAEHDSILVVSEWDYPGWKARVDDTPTEILRANGGLRAVDVPAGEHRVTFRYVPATVIVGGVMSVLASVFLVPSLGLLLIRTRPKRTTRL